MKVVSAAPLFPRSSFSTCTITSWPSAMASRIFTRPLPALALKYSFEISFKGRKPCLSAPKSTNAASKLGSTRVTLPLYMLAFFCSLEPASISKS